MCSDDGCDCYKKSFGQKLSLSLSLMLAFLAILYAVGLLGDMPAFLRTAVEERPAIAFFATIIASIILSAIISIAIPKKVGVIGRAPFFTCSFAWLFIGWSNLVERFPSQLTYDKMTLIILASLAIGFAVAYYKTSNLCFRLRGNVNSRRAELMMWTITIANALMFILVDALIGSIIAL
jgi:hypothetical protein